MAVAAPSPSGHQALRTDSTGAMSAPTTIRSNQRDNNGGTKEGDNIGAPMRAK
jgi:hypothetical protein